MLRPDFHKCQSHCPEPKMMGVNANFEIANLLKMEWSHEKKEDCHHLSKIGKQSEFWPINWSSWVKLEVSSWLAKVRDHLSINQTSIITPLFSFWIKLTKITKNFREILKYNKKALWNILCLSKYFQILIKIFWLYFTTKMSLIV